MNTSENLINLTDFDEGTFMARFGGLYEKSPWIAKSVWDEVNTSSSLSAEDLVFKLKDTVENSSDAEKLALLRAHPELAGRAAIEGKLTTESTDEQSKARLDRCTPEEYEQFHRLNEAYNKKFDFPFIMAIRNSNRVEILESFKHRLQNEINEEFRTALDNVHLIASLRLQAILSDDLG